VKIFLELPLALLVALHTLSARLGEFNAIEEQKAKLMEKDSERKSA
jgi:hypothetical protein